jgi:hypothetical protein
MTRFVITGKVSNPLAGSSLNEDLVISGRLDTKLKSLNLEVEKIETAGEDVTYYLRESKSGPKLLCD